jgi:hypothetical protein
MSHTLLTTEKAVGAVKQAVGYAIILSVLMLGTVVAWLSPPSGPKPTQLLFLDDNYNSGVVLCHGGAEVKGTANGYDVRYTAPDGAIVELHGVRKVDLTTLAKNDVRPACAK